jgi:hypothetical protein
VDGMMKVKLGMRKRVVSEEQSGRDRERVDILDIRREARGLRKRKKEKVKKK